MHENQDNDKQSDGHKSRHSSNGFREQRSMNRWQYRADQVQLRQQQVQSEMSTSVLVAAIVVAVFWNYAPHALMLGWVFAVISTVGIRSLFIATDQMKAAVLLKLSGIPFPYSSMQINWMV